MRLPKLLLLGTVVLLLGASLLLDEGHAQSDKQPAGKDRPRLNRNVPPGPAPEGMVWVPGGEFYMGVAKKQLPRGLALPDLFQDAEHVHTVYVDGFWMDRT